MSKIVQEKFEVRMPRVPEGSEGNWVSDRSARVKKGLIGGTVPQYNTLPQGMDIDDQENSDIRHQPSVMGGESDVSHDWNTEAVAKGFSRKEMRPTDDMYTREHNDAFYDEITVDGKTGFLERNNMLDRM